jgi:hypothetical protein
MLVLKLPESLQLPKKSDIIMKSNKEQKPPLKQKNNVEDSKLNSWVLITILE